MENPDLSGGQPVPMPNEFFVLCRTGIHFTAKSGSSKVDGNGSLFLSTLRMVFVSDRGGGGFDMPLATLYEEKFNQPIFGANNMTGLSPPLTLPEGSPAYKWCISFKNGGVGTFLPFFFRLLQEMRMRMQQPQAGVPTAQVRRRALATERQSKQSCPLACTTDAHCPTPVRARVCARRPSPCRRPSSRASCRPPSSTQPTPRNSM